MLANGVGQAILDGTVTPDTFMGPPVLIVGDNLTDTDPRWTAIVSWAADVGAPTGRVAPVIGFSPGESADTLDAVLLSHGRFFDVSANRPLVWSDGGSLTEERPCGPILSVPSSEGERSGVLLTGWNLSRRYVRLAGANHMYGIGLMAVGQGDPEIRATPPVYDVAPSADLPRALANILEVWQRGGPVALSAYAAIQAKEATRFGISRRFHPALVPLCLMDSPV